MKPKSISRYLWCQYNLFFILEHFLGFSLFNKLFPNARNRLFERITSHLVRSTENVNYGHTFTMVENVFSPAFCDRPVVFRNAASEWLCTGKWDFDYFQNVYGDRKVFLIDNAGLVDPNHPQTSEDINLKDFIDQIKNGSLKYLKLSSLVQREPNLQRDLDLNWLASFKKFGSFGETFYMFMGGKGSITPLHNEPPCNLYVQIYGQKKWILYMPEDRLFLDPRAERRTYFFSGVDPNNMDNTNFPLQKYAQKLEVILNPGDVLYVPPFAWHHIENISNSIGVAYKFVNLFEAWKSSKLLTILLFLATKPSIFYSFFVKRIKGEDQTLYVK